MTYGSTSGTQRPQGRRIISFVGAALLAIALIVVLRAVFTGDDEGEQPATANACEGDSVRLRVASSPEKVGIVERLAQTYSGRTVDGRCVEVQVQSKSSGAAMQALAKGWNEATDGPRPDVWSPAASGWVTMLRQELASTDKTGVLTEDKPESVVTAPLVIAMPKPMAEALGWPDKSVSWRDLATLATDSRGWARHGHPEWGKFRLGKTNPNLSTSGLNATIGAYMAATGISSDLTDADLKRKQVKEFVGDVEQSVVHYGDTTLTFLANLQEADDRGAAMSYISAVTVEENSIIAYNSGNPSGDPKTAGQHAPPKVPLAAVYPSDGTLLSDHPFTVLAWADDTRRKIATDFLAFLRNAESQQLFLEQGFRGFDGKPGPQATEANGVLPKAELNLVTPPSPPVLAKLLNSWSELRKHANVLLVVDVSGSMQQPVEGTGLNRLELAKQAAIRSLSQFADRDKVGLWMFSSGLDGTRDYQELVPVGPVGGKLGDSTRRDELEGRLGGLIPQGGTGLYDTTLAAHRFMAGRIDPEAINAVVVLTDGRNEKPGSISLDNLLAQLRSEDGAAGGEAIRLFTIGYSEQADAEVLRQIAKATRGAHYDSSRPDTIDQVFTAVISNF